MQLIPRSSITISPSRQRTEIQKPPLNELKDSILKLGLLNPPTFVQRDTSLFQLVAGERRLRAIDLLAEEKKSFLCNGQIVEPGMVPILLFSREDRLSRFEAELEENLIRVDLPWQDRTRALAELHKLRTAENPSQSLRATATEVATRMVDTSSANVAQQYKSVRIAAAIAPFLEDPTILKARTETEAYQLVLKQEAEKYGAELLRRRKVKAESDLRINLRCADAMELMPSMDEAQFDLILSDPPYGVGADGDGYRDRTVLHHNYDDSPENARRILQAILTEGFRLTKPKANLFLFTDIQHFDWLCQHARQMAWTPWRFPVIWQKSVSEGLVPWGRNGFIHTYDVIFFATKGRKGLSSPLVDILSYPRVARSERVYAAEKPLPLLERLIEHSTLPGDVIFDPCAGSGSTLIAAKRLKRHAVGLEIDQKVVDLATVRIAEGDKQDGPEMVLPEL